MLNLNLNATFAVKASGSGIDPDAAAFLSAAGITGATITTAINTLTSELKDAGIWDKSDFIYPMVGGSASSHSYNLKNPAQFQLTFNGGWTHNSSGAIPNGTNAYAQTGYNPSTEMTINDTHLAFYSQTNSNASAAVGKTDIGTQVTGPQSYFMAISSFASFIGYAYTNAAGRRILQTNPANSSGFAQLINQSATALKAFFARAGTRSQIGSTITLTGGSLPNNEIYLGVNGYTGNLYEYSNRGCSYASTGAALSDTQAADQWDIVEQFQTNLGRAV